jgi:hypothetical protein
LIRGLIQRLAEARRGDKKCQKENKKMHCSIFNRMTADCQQRERAKRWVAFLSLNPVVALNSALRFTPLEIMPRCSLRAMRPSLRGRSPTLRAGSWGGAWTGGKKVETAF